MKSVINIKDKEYEIKYVSDLSFDKYNDLQQFINNIKDPVKMCKYILMVLCDISIEVLEDIEEESLLLLPYMDILQRQKEIKSIDKIGTYKLINLEKMFMNKFIDFEEIITSNYKIEEIVGLMFLPDEYNYDDYIKCVESIKNNMNVGEALLHFNTYLEYRKDFYDKYSGLFTMKEEVEDKKDDDENDDFEDDDTVENTVDESGINRWGLKGMVYSLSDGDILKVDRIMHMNHLSVFEYLSYKKDVDDYIKEQENKHRNKSSIF